jgi:hypothetical protein
MAFRSDRGVGAVVNPTCREDRAVVWQVHQELASEVADLRASEARLMQQLSLEQPHRALAAAPSRPPAGAIPAC